MHAIKCSPTSPLASGKHSFGVLKSVPDLSRWIISKKRLLEQVFVTSISSLKNLKLIQIAAVGTNSRNYTLQHFSGLCNKKQ